jgi:hypothetical protein
MQLEKPPIMMSETTEVKTEVKAKPVKAKVQSVSRTIVFSGPAGELPGYMGRRIDLAQLTTRQQQTIYSLLAGLVRDGAKLINGTPVTAPSHAIKWMLENSATE